MHPPSRPNTASSFAGVVLPLCLPRQYILAVPKSNSELPLALSRVTQVGIDVDLYTQYLPSRHADLTSTGVRGTDTSLPNKIPCKRAWEPAYVSVCEGVCCVPACVPLPDTCVLPSASPSGLI